MVVEGEESGACPQLDDVEHVATRRTCRVHQLRAQGTTAGGLTLRTDDDQPTEEAPHALPGGVVERPVQLLGPGGDGPVDATQLLVAREGQVPVGLRSASS